MKPEVQEALKDILSHPQWVEMKSYDSNDAKFMMRGHIPLGKNFKMRRTIKVETLDMETCRWVEILSSLSHPIMVLVAVMAVIPGVLLFGSFLDNSLFLFVLGMISASIVGYMEFHVMELRKSLSEICKLIKKPTQSSLSSAN